MYRSGRGTGRRGGTDLAGPNPGHRSALRLGLHAFGPLKGALPDDFDKVGLITSRPRPGADDRPPALGRGHPVKAVLRRDGRRAAAGGASAHCRPAATAAISTIRNSWPAPRSSCRSSPKGRVLGRRWARRARRWRGCVTAIETGLVGTFRLMCARTCAEMADGRDADPCHDHGFRSRSR